MSYLLDTCILSKLRRIKRYPDPKLEAWINKHHELFYFISVLSIGEIQLGIDQLPEQEKKKKRDLEDWLYGEIIPRFQDRILPIDPKVALTWGKLQATSRKKGLTIPSIDGLIAATAMHHELIVVTENVKDFEKTESKIFNPWE